MSQTQHHDIPRHDHLPYTPKTEKQPRKAKNNAAGDAPKKNDPTRPNPGFRKIVQNSDVGINTNDHEHVK